MSIVDQNIRTLRRHLTTIACVAIAALFAAPLYLVITNVFKPGSLIDSSPWSVPTHPTFGNLSAVLGRPDHLFWNSLINSVEITGASMLITALVSSMLGYAIARSRHIAARITMAVLLAGLMIPGAVIITPLTQILRSVGLMNSLVGLVLVNVGYLVPFGVFLFAGFVRTIPLELEEAAAIDGAGRMRTFWQVVFPLLRPATASVLIFIGVWIWSDFLTPLILLGPSSGTTVTVGVYRAIGEHSTNLGSLFAFMFMASLPVLILFVVFQKDFVKGLTAGAVK